MRGFSSVGLTVDGLTNQGGNFFPAIEDKDRLEVLQGVTGFLYGVGNVAGDLNMPLKRPTSTMLNEVDLGDNAGKNFYIHGDFGGPLKFAGVPDGLFGYRLNLVEQTGDTSMLNQKVDRNLESVAIDAHLPDNALLQFNASHAYYALNGASPFYILSGITQFPAPTNPANLPAIPWEEESDTTDTVGLGLTWKLNDIFTLRSRWNFTDDHHSSDAVTYDYITSNSGTMYAADLGGGSGWNYYTHSAYTFVDASFSVLGVQNKVTTGVNGYYQWYNIGGIKQTAPSTHFTGNFYDQTAINFYTGSITPTTTQTAGYVENNNYNENFMIGDEIKPFGDKLIILVGANYAVTGTETFNTTETPTSSYDSAALTPTAAVIYKILPWISTYASFQQSLSPGTDVVNSGSIVYTNAGAVLPPYLGTQYEGGVKATIATNLLATFAVFHIDRANLYTQVNSNGTETELEGGSQIGEGIETSVTGKLTPDLSIFGGLTLENLRVENNPSSPWQNGQIPPDASSVTFKLYSEYTIPFLTQAPWLHGLTLTGGFSYIGPFSAALPSSAAGVATIDYLPGYAVGDLGFRYRTDVYGHPTTLRFTATNVTNHAYWAAYGQEGAPRTFLASAEMKW